jgi:tyrosyl-tRNA synthetase
MTYYPKSEFLSELTSRGFLADCTDYQGLDDRLAKEVVTGYIGFDLTASSLHIGNLVQIMLLRWMQKTGHRPITLMGGGTTKVGDPSGKDEMRKMLSVAQIDANADSIRTVFSRYISYGDGPTDSPLVNNAEWLDKLGYIDFLRDIGPHFTINRLLSFESVKSRLDREQSLSFIEFNYMLLQAYDFLDDPADGRIGPMGQHRLWHRSYPAGHGDRGLRADHAAGYPVGRQEDGQVGGRRGLAECGQDGAV